MIAYLELSVGCGLEWVEAVESQATFWDELMLERLKPAR